MLAAFQGAMQRLENAVARVDAVEGDDDADALPLDELERATAQAEQAVEGVEAVVGTSEEPPPPAPVRRLDRA